MDKTPWYYQPWIVILLLIFVLGPFGLPLVYKSPKFNKTFKVILTVLTILYTAYLVEVTVKTINEILATMPQIRALLR